MTDTCLDTDSMNGKGYEIFDRKSEVTGRMGRKERWLNKSMVIYCPKFESNLCFLQPQKHSRKRKL